MKKLFFAIIAICLSAHSFAQEDLFGKDVTKAPAKTRKGWLITLNGDLDAPAGDMAKRFGGSYRIGPSLLYKTDRNWVFGAKGDFIWGNRVHQDSLMINIKDKYGEFLSKDGYRIGVPTHERGYDIGLEAGKIVHIGGKVKDNGILFLTTVGFIQHKIDIYDKDHDVTQLRGQYLKGYDRLTNGTFVEEYICYNHLAADGLLNFHIGLDALFGFTKGRRDYLFDVMRPDNGNRVDILFGIRGGWYLPIYKRKSEEIYFQ
jgi:hypothetical protein